jgi:hypothetical protein
MKRKRFIVTTGILIGIFCLNISGKGFCGFSQRAWWSFWELWWCLPSYHGPCWKLKRLKKQFESLSEKAVSVAKRHGVTISKTHNCTADFLAISQFFFRWIFFFLLFSEPTKLHTFGHCLLHQFLCCQQHYTLDWTTRFVNKLFRCCNNAVYLFLLLAEADIFYDITKKLL